MIASSEFQMSNKSQTSKSKYFKLLTLESGILFVIWILPLMLPQLSYAAIVPNCAQVRDAQGNPVPCTSYCDLLQLVKNVINFMMYIIFPIAAIGIVVGGFNIMFAGGSPERAKKGRGIITSAVVGLAIALLAWIIIDTIIKIIAPNFSVSNLGPWNALQCNPPSTNPPVSNNPEAM